jgi:molecular chaperone GrpE
VSWWRRLFLEPMPKNGSQSAAPEAASDLDRLQVTEKAETSAAHAELLGRLDRLQEDVAKLGREQFRATTLLEGHDTVLEELAEASREDQSRREDAALQERRARAELETRVRLELVKELLPVADALDASVRTARELLAEFRVAPPSSPPSRSSWLAWLRAPAAPLPTDKTTGDHPAAFDAWLRGLLLIEGRLQSLLEREGVRPIRALGETFDPHRHLAVAISRENGVPDGTVVAEELRGYMAGERVLRPAEVVVVRAEGELRRSDLNAD